LCLSKVDQCCRKNSKFCRNFRFFRRCAGVVRRLRTCCQKSRISALNKQVCQYRLYKPFARKPWLTVYRAHTGFLSVLQILLVVCVFLLSSLRFYIVVSDGASISFWQISSKKFERLQAMAHGHANSKIWWKT
jgi:hypothetical protein